MTSKKSFVMILIMLLLFLFASCTKQAGEAFKLTGKQRIPSEPKIDSLSLSASIPSPKIEKTDRGYDSLKIKDAHYIGNPGEPSIPAITRRILLPQGYELDSIELTRTGKQELHNVLIEPVQQPIPIMYQNLHNDALYSEEIVMQELNEKFGDNIPTYFFDKDGNLIMDYFRPTPPDPEIYESIGPFPEEDYDVVSVQEFRGYKILILNIFPVKYFPQDKRVEYYSDISFQVKTKEIPNFQVSRAFKGSVSDEEEVKLRVDNFEKLNTYKKESSVNDKPILGADSDYKYVIITTEEFAPAFQPLVNWKISRPENPITATIVTVESILSNPDYYCNSPYMLSLSQNYADNYCDVDGHDDTAARIRNFIRHAYVNWNTEYVLLGGDADRGDVGWESGDDIVPVRVFIKASVGGILYEVEIPSDLYYGCLDGSFDESTNGIFGEPNDGINGGEVDLFAEVYVGRAPIDSVQEVQNFITKTIAYEQSDTDYLTKVLLVGEYLGGFTYASNYMEELNWGTCNRGYCTEGLAWNYDVNTLYDSDDYTWNITDLIDIMNQGVHFINHLGHSTIWGNMKLCHAPVPYNACADLDLLNNSEYFLIYTQGCFPASFDNRIPPSDIYGDYSGSDSIAEYFVVNPNGAFAFIGNSRYGLVYESQHFHRKFIDAIIAYNIRNLGKANQISKEENLGSINYYGMRYVYYELNLLGDPETSLKQPLFEGLMARIYDPKPGGVEVDGIINITGIAFGGTETPFDHYTLEWGIGYGLFIDEWFTEGITLINDGYEPVLAGLLGTFDTLSAPEGLITIKLTVFSDDNTTNISYNVPIEVNNTKLLYPSDYDIFRYGDIIEIKGELNGHHITDYSLSWTNCGPDPIHTHNEGITLVNIGDTIGFWNTSEIDGFIESQYHDCFISLVINYDIYPISSEGIDYIHLDPSLKKGWPVVIPFEEDEQTGYFYEAGYLDAGLGDLDGDGNKELVFYTGGNPPKIRIFNADGSEFGFWSVGNMPRNGDYLNKPALADIDKDGKDEILVFSSSTWEGEIQYPSFIHAFNADGSEVEGWPIVTPVSNHHKATISVVDLDFDGSLEVILQNHHNDESITIFKSDGTVRAHCLLEDYEDLAVIEPTPAVGNFDDDNELEIVAVLNSDDWESHIFVINPDCSLVEGWPLEFHDEIQASPSIGDLDNNGELEIILGSKYTGVYVFDKTGNVVPYWPLSRDSRSSAALGDFDDDGFLEVVIGDRSANVYLINKNGMVLPNWPQEMGWSTGYSSIIANVDNDPELEIIITSGSSYYEGVYAWNYDGSTVTGFPKSTERVARAPAMVADLDNDGRSELIASADDNWNWRYSQRKNRGSIYVWELDSEYDPLKMPWPQFHHDSQHTGLYARICNEVFNPSFEFDKGIDYIKKWSNDDAIYHNNIPDGWYGSGPAGGIDVDFILDSGHKVDGGRSVRMDLSSTRAWVAQQIPVTYGKTYRISGWMKTDLQEGFGIISTHCFDENRNMLPPACGLDNYDEERMLYGENDWQYFEFEVKADMSQAAYLQVQCYASPGIYPELATGTIWCDDFKVIEIEKESYKTILCGKHCSDGTPSGKCKSGARYGEYCFDGKIWYDCQLCGCTSGYECQPDGKCTSTEPIGSPIFRKPTPIIK